MIAFGVVDSCDDRFVMVVVDNPVHVDSLKMGQIVMLQWEPSRIDASAPADR